MKQRRYIAVLLLMAWSTAAVRAQTADDRHKRMPNDSLKSDYEQWLQHEPLPSPSRDTTGFRPLPPSALATRPAQLVPDRPKVNINIMTPAFKTEMQLAYQSHWLEEQRKAQQGGAMTISVGLPSLIGFVLGKVFPHRRSAKQREREKLQLVLDNY